MTPTKRCPRCATTKPISAFAAAAHTPDRLQVWCRDCQSYAGRSDKPAQRLHKRAYDRALAALRDAHPAEFRALLDAQRAALDLPVRVRPEGDR